MSIQLKLSNPDQLHQVILFRGKHHEVWGCRGWANEKNTIVEFDYDGYSGEAADWANVIGLSDFGTHPITAMAVDIDGNVGSEYYTLSATEATHPRPQTLLYISGDNQQGRANAQLAQPLVVEVRDQHNNPLPDARVTFAIIAGDGRLNGRFSLENAMTGADGQAEKTLTVGTGRTIVEVTIQERAITQTRVFFDAVGVGAPTMSIMDGDYQRWHLPEGTIVRLGKGRIGKSDRAVVFSPEGQLLAVASSIGVWLYDAATSQELALLPTTRSVHSVAFSSNGQTLAAGVEGGVILWDIAARTQIASLALRFPDDRVAITSVSFSSGEGTIAFMSLWTETVKLWDVATGNVTTLEDQSGGESGGITLLSPTTGPTIRPQSVSFSPGGRLLASGSIDGTVKLWDVGTQTLLAALPGHRLQVTSVSFSRDGRLLASGSIDETVKLWDVMTGENIATLKGHKRSVNSVAFSPDGRLLASGAYVTSGYDATIKLWNIASEQNTNTFVTHQGGTRSVSFSPDGRILASGATDGTVKLWDIESGKIEHVISGHASVGESVSFSPDGTLLASGSSDGTVKLWEVLTGRNIATFGPHTLRVTAVSFSPDGTLLASGSVDRTTKLWNIAMGTTHASRFTYNCRGWVRSVAFSPDGKILATGDYTALLLWNNQTGEELSTPFGYASAINSVTFSPNPNNGLLAFGSDFGVKLWDVAAHTPIASLGEAFQVDALAFSPDGSVLASNSPNQSVTLWDVLARKKIGTFARNVYDGDIKSLLFSPNGAILATGHIGGRIKLWDVATQLPLATLEGGTGSFPGITSLSFSDDMVLASGSEGDGTVLLWDLSELALHSPESVDEAIPDPNLRAAIETALGVELDDPISLSGLAALDRLDASEMEIRDLTGLEFATNLTSLHLNNNSISDISAVEGLTNLEWLILSQNNISDISPLIANTGLGEGDTVSVRGNPLSHTSIHTQIPILQNRGVDVQFDAIVVQPEDVNGDGSVNILDLVSIASNLGTQGQNLAADINRDGVVNILDLVLVAGALGNAAAAPSMNAQALKALSASEAGRWLAQVGELDLTDPASREGVLYLEQLLAALNPNATALLPNYPNPFNPETWIPYQLAEDADVTLTIYDNSGIMVRRLELGHQLAGYYAEKEKAAYWDGRNILGENVASGVYVYHLSAGNYSAARKMLIIK